MTNYPYINYCVLLPPHDLELPPRVLIENVCLVIWQAFDVSDTFIFGQSNRAALITASRYLEKVKSNPVHQYALYVRNRVKIW